MLSACSLSSQNTSRVPKPPLTEEEKTILQKATFAGGCFWCSESDFEKHEGVRKVISGYIGEGDEKNANYSAVSEGRTQFREGIQLLYNPDKISYNALLDIYWKHIDPTDDGGQFADRGTQYRTAIYTHTSEQYALAQESKRDLEKQQKFSNPIVTEILPFPAFFPAEQYHQDYSQKNSKKYHQYREGSGRNDFIEKHWEGDVSHSDLTALQYHVTQEDGTEKPFDNEYWDNKKPGIYVDLISGDPLYSSTDKYNSGTGWPSFTKPLEEKNITEVHDTTLSVPRREIRSVSSDSHLGHVFPDGPKETGLRYCMNSAAFRFVPLEDMEEEGYGEYLYLFH